MRIAAYLRVSTDQQSHDSQRGDLEDYCKSQKHAPLVAALLGEGLSAAEIGRRLGLPYSTTTELVREIRAAQCATAI